MEDESTQLFPKSGNQKRSHSAEIENGINKDKQSYTQLESRTKARTRARNETKIIATIIVSVTVLAVYCSAVFFCTRPSNPGEFLVLLESKTDPFDVEIQEDNYASTQTLLAIDNPVDNNAVVQGWNTLPGWRRTVSVTAVAALCILQHEYFSGAYNSVGTALTQSAKLRGNSFLTTSYRMFIYFAT